MPKAPGGGGAGSAPVSAARVSAALTLAPWGGDLDLVATAVARPLPPMKPYALLLLGLVGATSALIWHLARQPLPPNGAQSLAPAPRVSPASVPTLHQAAAASASAPRPMEAGVEAEPPAQPAIALLADPVEGARRVAVLAATQDPAMLPELGAYLLHPDPGLRRKTLDAFLRLDDPRAAPLLRTAAAWEEANGDADAAVKLHATADFVAQAPLDREGEPVLSVAEASRSIADAEVLSVSKPSLAEP
jgi:hypothetical protein